MCAVCSQAQLDPDNIKGQDIPMALPQNRFVVVLVAFFYGWFLSCGLCNLGVGLVIGLVVGLVVGLVIGLVVGLVVGLGVR